MRRWAPLVALLAAPALVLAVFFVLPVSGMIARGLGPDTLAVLARPRVHRVLWFTVWSSSAATLAALVLGVPASYTLYRLSWRRAEPLRGLVRGILLVPFVLPTVVVGIAFRELFRGALAGLDGSAWGILAGLVFFNVSVVVRTVGLAWASLDPRPGEAAAALGAPPVTVFRTVTLPSLRPAIVGAGAVVFLFCATAFGVVLTLGGLRYSSVETEIYLLTTNLLDLRGAAALSLLQLLAVTVLLVVAGRLRSRPVPQAIVPPRPVPARIRDVPVLAVTTLLVLFVAVPLGVLVSGSLHAGGGWSLANYRALGSAVAPALSVSLRTAVGATLAALVLGLLVSVAVTRPSRSRVERRVRGLVDALVMLPLGVSAVTLGFGFLITLGRWRDSPWLVPIAQALVALPLVVRTLVPVLGAVDDRQRQAAASLGASPLRAVLVVDVPALWRPLLASAGLAFAVSVGEFGATSFLARSDAPTLPVVIYRLLSHPGALSYGEALAGSVILASVTAVVMLAVEQLRVPAIGAL